MTETPEEAAEDLWHNTYHHFLFAVEILACPAEEQCQRMGDFSTAWELRTDALYGQYLLGSGMMTEQQESGLRSFLAIVDAVPADEMASGSGRAINLEAMQEPEWEPIRALAQGLLVLLRPATEANHRYFWGDGGPP